MGKYDNEQNIIKDIQLDLSNKNVLLLNGNSFERKLLKYFRDIDSLIPHNAHSDPPPDYYSDKYKIMFDVMRVNDTEIEYIKNNKIKYKNAKMSRERKMEKEALDLLKYLNISNDVEIICNSESDDINEHSFENYKNNVTRVLSQHINKIPIWKPEHNDYYKGLLIFDETECCFNGSIKYVKDELYTFKYDASKPLVIHEPWNDANFIQQAYQSHDLDFIVWYCPYKQYSAIAMKTGTYIPKVVFIDVRYSRTNYYDYSMNHLVL